MGCMPLFYNLMASIHLYKTLYKFHRINKGKGKDYS